MEQFKIWLNKRSVKRALTRIIPIVITLLGSLISIFTSFSHLYFIILCCLSVIYYFLSNYYEKNEEDKNLEIKTLNDKLIFVRQRE
ncbi:hypothetical protein, partial [Faecalitalea cylindroides]|uniref:hypothetical protein n=1 Tax=Faecalitalea cylindroides TaxID=39483 RepID=UPI0039F4FC22